MDHKKLSRVTTAQRGVCHSRSDFRLLWSDCGAPPLLYCSSTRRSKKFVLQLLPFVVVWSSVKRQNTM